MFAIGGYAVVLLAAVLVLEAARDPVPQQPYIRHPGEDERLRAWPRMRRDCMPGSHERALPLRAAREATPARRRRSAPRSCRR